jgi:hypothetical protein
MLVAGTGGHDYQVSCDGVISAAPAYIQKFRMRDDVISCGDVADDSRNRRLVQHAAPTAFRILGRRRWTTGLRTDAWPLRVPAVHDS